jgi:hypothetical protein
MRAVWERCVRVSDSVICQDEAGRLWDVLFLLFCSIRRDGGQRVIAFGDDVPTPLSLRPRPPRAHRTDPD